MPFHAKCHQAIFYLSVKILKTKLCYKYDGYVQSKDLLMVWIEFRVWTTAKSDKTYFWVSKLKQFYFHQKKV